ncbi:MAG: hypothetical protein AB7P04_09285 [Bacteriovoracia bacterium]
MKMKKLSLVLSAVMVLSSVAGLADPPTRPGRKPPVAHPVPLPGADRLGDRRGPLPGERNERDRWNRERDRAENGRRFGDRFGGNDRMRNGDEIQRRFDRNDLDEQGARRRAQVANQRLDQAKDSLVRLDQDLTRRQNELNNATAARDAIQTTITNSTNEINTVTQANPGLPAELNALRNHLQALRQGRPAAVSARDQKKGQFDLVNGQLAPLKTARDNAVAAAKAAKDDLTAKEATAADLQGKLTAAQAKVTELQNQANQMGPELATLVERQKAIPGEMQKNKEAQDATTKEIAALEEKIKATDSTKPDPALVQALAAAKRKLAALQHQAQTLNQESQRVNARIAEIQKTLPTIQQQLVAANQAVLDLTTKVNNANSAVAAAKTAVQTTKAAETAAVNAFQTKKTEVDQIKGELDAANAAITDLDNKITAANRLVELKTLLQAKTTELTQAEIQVAAKKQLRDEAKAQRDRSAEGVANLKRESDEAEANVRQVNENIREAKRLAAQFGRDDAAAPGAAVGTSWGISYGNQMGGEQGSLWGRDQAQGQIDGFREGGPVGWNRGESEANRDGEAAGRTSGRNEQYPIGRSDGRKYGEYNQGYNDQLEGYPAGKQNAQNEANRVGIPEGRRATERDFYNVPLKNVTIANDGGPEVPGAISQAFGEPDFRSAGEYQPVRHYGYLSDEVADAYYDSYDFHFVEFARTAFWRQFNATFPIVFEQARSSSYEQWMNLITYDAQGTPDYTQYQNAVRNQGAVARVQDPQTGVVIYAAEKSAAYQAEEARVRDIRYGQVYPGAVVRGKGSVTVDAQGRVTGSGGSLEGYNQGRTQAIADGKADGIAKGYSDHYTDFLGKAKQKGSDIATSYFNGFAVMQAEAVSIVEDNGDAVFAPGETGSIQLVMKNYGKVSQDQPVKVRVKLLSNGILMNATETDLVALPSQSRSTVTGLLPFQIPQDVAIGSRQSLQITVDANIAVLEEDGRTSRRNVQLMNQELRFTVSYPYSVPQVAVKNLVTAEEETTATISVKNVSNKASAKSVMVRMVSLDGLSTVVKNDVLIGNIAVNEVRNATLSLTVPKANAGKELSFQVQVFEGNWLLGLSRFTVNSTKSWEYNPGSAGLLIVANRDLMNSAERIIQASGMPLDILDLGIPTNVTKQAIVSKYAGKMIILPEVTGAMDAELGNALEAYVKAGGKLYANLSFGGSETQVGAGISRVKATDWVNTRTVEGMALSRPSTRELTDLKPFSVGVDTNNRDRSVQGIANRIATFALVTQSFEETLAAYIGTLTSGNQAVKGVTGRSLVHMLNQEAMDDYWIAEGKKKSKEDKKSIFRDDKRKQRSLLVKFVTEALNSVHNETVRMSLVKFQPVIRQIRQEVYYVGPFATTGDAYVSTFKNLTKAFDELESKLKKEKKDVKAGTALEFDLGDTVTDEDGKSVL